MEDGSNGWFYAKRYGFGTGLPRSWQGWLVTALYLAVMIGGAFLIGEHEIAFLGVALPATAIFMVVAMRTTSGGWKWRWGKDRDDGTW